jgi:RimJ/RimL family protein N-acetyltransferase
MISDMDTEVTLLPVEEDDPVHRIEAATDIENVAEQRVLEKAGFTREGVLRGIGWRDGCWRDGVTYRILRTDQPA